MNKQTVLVLVLLACIAGWYFTKPGPIDMDVAKEAYEKNVKDMQSRATRNNKTNGTSEVAAKDNEKVNPSVASLNQLPKATNTNGNGNGNAIANATKEVALPEDNKATGSKVTDESLPQGQPKIEKKVIADNTTRAPNSILPTKGTNPPTPFSFPGPQAKAEPEMKFAQQNDLAELFSYVRWENYLLRIELNSTIAASEMKRISTHLRSSKSKSYLIIDISQFELASGLVEVCLDKSKDTEVKLIVCPKMTKSDVKDDLFYIGKFSGMSTFPADMQNKTIVPKIMFVYAEKPSTDDPLYLKTLGFLESLHNQ